MKPGWVFPGKCPDLPSGALRCGQNRPSGEGDAVFSVISPWRLSLSEPLVQSLRREIGLDAPRDERHVVPGYAGKFQLGTQTAGKSQGVRCPGAAAAASFINA